MQKILLIVTLISSIAAATYAADESGSGPDGATLPIPFKLWKFPYASAKRTTFRLEFSALEPDVTVRVWCNLRQSQRGLGRFPLRSLQKDETLQFSVACLADELALESEFRLQVLRGDESQGFFAIPLSDAKLKLGRKRNESSDSPSP